MELNTHLYKMSMTISATVHPHKGKMLTMISTMKGKYIDNII